MVISMIGFGASLALPSEPIGFLGLLPGLLGIWELLELLIPYGEEEEEEAPSFSGTKSVLKVATITVINGDDNIGTYIPLFSQTKVIFAVVTVSVILLCGGAMLWHRLRKKTKQASDLDESPQCPPTRAAQQCPENDEGLRSADEAGIEDGQENAEEPESSNGERHKSKYGTFAKDGRHLKG
ncbi:hypothetical protein HYE68_005339 [Fusarium pseudograminearum]|nr:hypothetical protein HYE68_005339 [Fusarium pseudograminearum]